MQKANLCCSVAKVLPFHLQAQKMNVSCIHKGCLKARFKIKHTVHTERKYSPRCSQRPLNEAHDMSRHVQYFGKLLDVLICMFSRQPRHVLPVHSQNSSHVD